MNELCSNCKNRCEMVYYHTNKVAKKFVCYIQQDSGQAYIPMQWEGNKEKCDYFQEYNEEV